MELPPGFTAHVGNIGIRDDTTDFAVIACSGVATAAARFTRSRFAGPSVEVSRRALADERLRAVVVVSKNANVATGAAGLADAEELAQRVGDLVEGEPTDVLVTSTGVIGRPYPMDRVRRYLDDLTSHAGRAERFPVTDAGAVAEAMMTTDTVPKMAEAQVGDLARHPAHLIANHLLHQWLREETIFGPQEGGGEHDQQQVRDEEKGIEQQGWHDQCRHRQS